MAKKYENIELTGVVNELGTTMIKLKNGMVVDLIKTVFSTDELDETVKGYQVLVSKHEKDYENGWYDSFSVLTKKEANKIIKDYENGVLK